MSDLLTYLGRALNQITGDTMGWESRRRVTRDLEVTKRENNVRFYLENNVLCRKTCSLCLIKELLIFFYTFMLALCQYR